MADCGLEVFISGEQIPSDGVPRALRVWGRITSGNCQRVQFVVRTSQDGIILFSGQAQPDSNGTWSSLIPLVFPAWPCDAQLWVEAECLIGGECSASRQARIDCKDSSSPSGPGNNGSPPDGSSGSGESDWPWPDPPHLWCPMTGRAFTEMLWLGLSLVLFGLAFYSIAVVTAGLATAGLAFGLYYSRWITWCAPSACYFWGAIFWVLSRLAVGGLLLAAVTRSVFAGICAMAFGAIAGSIYVYLIRLRCTPPSLRTPLNQLPLW